MHINVSEEPAVSLRWTYQFFFFFNSAWVYLTARHDIVQDDDLNLYMQEVKKEFNLVKKALAMEKHEAILDEKEHFIN